MPLAPPSADPPLDSATQDLRPLAWVADDVRRCLDTALQGLRAAMSSPVLPADAPGLEAAAGSLRQARGALQMVGRPGLAAVMEAMELVLAHWRAQQPAQPQAALATFERAGFAVAEFIEALLLGRTVDAVSLFPQYRDLLALAGEVAAQPPANPLALWEPPAGVADGLEALGLPEDALAAVSVAGPWPLAFLSGGVPTLQAGPALRARLDAAALRWVRAADPEAARELAALAAGIARGFAGSAASRPFSDRSAASDASALPASGSVGSVSDPTGPPDALAPLRRLWRLAAAFFEALALAPSRVDLPAKRAASRLLAAYAQGTGGPGGVDVEHLARELLFTCAAVGPVEAAQAPRLAAVRAVCGLAEAPALDPVSAPFGRFDPALLATVRRHLVAVREAWAGLAGGEVRQLRTMLEQFAQAGAALQRLHPPLAPVGEALAAAAEHTASLSGPPPAPLGMEVATAILFLEAVCQAFDPMDRALGERAARLAERLARVQRGAPPEPLEPWMESLFRQASDRQTLGSVVDELRVSLSEIETALDSYFRQPGNRAALQDVPGRLSQMRGVLSVLGLDHATRAVLRMRDQVQALWAEPEGPQAASLVERLGHNLGALGFLVDMLHHQPTLARQLFVFDDERGELRHLMGRAGSAASVDRRPAPTGSVETNAPLQPAAAVVMTPAVPIPTMESADDDELRAVFLAEAREVLDGGRQALATLTQAPADLSTLTVLRRCFHTLKGSARMVGFQSLGEAAWSLEQLLNAWLAEGRPADGPLLEVAGRAVDGLARWVDDLAQGHPGAWEAAPFVRAAEALRQQGQVLTLALPGDAPVADGFDAGPLEATGVEAAPIDDASVDDVSAEAAFRHIGPLRIASDLLNVFLQEADDDSLQLQDGLAAWAAQPGLPPSAELETLAHSLAGSSATVGLAGLSELARQIEMAVLRLRLEGARAADDTARAQAASALVDAGDHLRQLLHQFAAGLLREPDARLFERLTGLARVDEAPAMAIEVIELASDVGSSLPEETRIDVLPAAVPAPGSSGALSPVGADAADAASASAHAVDPFVFALFEEEAVELLPQLDAAWREWLEQSGGGGTDENGGVGHTGVAGQMGDAMLRLLHTFKGGARLAGLWTLGEQAHAIESLVESLPALAPAVRDAAMDEVSIQLDRLRADFEAARPSASTADRPGKPAIAAPAHDAPLGTPAATMASPGSMAVAASPAPAIPPPPPRASTADGELPPPRAGQGGVVRVRAHLLDRLMNQAGEVMITGARIESELGGLRDGLHDLASSVERLRQQLREVELQAETRMASQPSAGQGPDAPGFDPLEFDRFTRLHELTRIMAESVNDIATLQRQLARSVDATEDDLSSQSRQTRELQRDLLRTRMLEFDSVAERLHRAVRQAAKDSGKAARLEIEGGTLEIDRGMLDRITPALEHLVRNAVAHGIESAAAREQAGKPPVGRLRVQVEQVGNDVGLRFQDDGGGLDLARIAQRARSLGLLGEGESLTPDAAADLIFRTGFSTARQLSELSGRGVGLDVVRSDVQALGGRIEVRSEPGQGTCFRLVLPLTTAVTHVVMMRCDDLRFGVPASLVDTVLRADAEALAQAQASGTWEPVDEAAAAPRSSAPVPFFWGGALLRTSPASDPGADRTSSVVLLQSAAQRLALQVDEVLGHREVVVKHLGPQLSRLPGLAGMTVLASGEVILIYNPVALATIYGDRARRFAASVGRGGAAGRPAGGAEGANGNDGAGRRGGGEAASAAWDGAPSALDPAGPASSHPAAASLAPLVLVVDDSITVRRVTQRLLQREGYRVALAADGLQALERLAQETPALVLSDIEMPRMDGFELARHLRGDPRWSGLPLIVITSRTAAKHRDHAQSLGIAHYLGKPYVEDELLALVRRYTQPMAPGEGPGSAEGASSSGGADPDPGSRPTPMPAPDQAGTAPGFLTTA